MKAARRSERSAEQIQPDPMLQEHRRASPIALGIAAIFALMIVGVVFYGLSRDVGPATVTAGSSETPGSTSGQAPTTDAKGPAQNDKSNTATQDPGGAQSSGQAQPGKQGQGAPAGKSGDSR